MDSSSNSPIQAWVDFKGYNWPTDAPQCQTISDDGGISGGPTNCTTVCEDLGAILNDVGIWNNLLTCGLWATMTWMAFSNNDFTIYTTQTSDPPDSLTDRFKSLGLDASNATYVFAVRNAVSNVMGLLAKNTRAYTYQYDPSSTGSCSEQALFPTTTYNPIEVNIHQGLQNCVSTICAPDYLNPDLGGIGLFISVLMQLCITIIISLGLLGLKFWPSFKEKNSKNHLLSLCTALVEFHKAQCYFISSIEVAILVLNGQAYAATSHLHTPVFDILLSCPLAMNGFIPIVFTLTCISYYSRLTWHIIILSLIPFILSTAALALASYWAWSVAIAASSGFRYSSEASSLVCGWQSDAYKNLRNVTHIRFFAIWLTYAYCILCGFWCLIMHTLDQPPTRSKRERILRALKRLAHRFPLARYSKETKLRMGYTCLTVIWVICFAYHFYLYSLFAKAHLVSPAWSFGQIIAVTVWVPSIIEYFYLEHKGFEDGSKYRYPPGVQVKANLPSSESADNIELLPQPSSDPDLSGNESLLIVVTESSTEYSPIAGLPSLATEDAGVSSMSHHMKTW